MADEIRATPRSPLFGLFSDIVNVPLDYMSSPQRTQQLQGLASLIRSTGVPSTLQNLSYDPSGRGLFTGAGGLGGTSRMRPEALDAAMTVAPMVGSAARAISAGGRSIAPTAARMQTQQEIAPLLGYHRTTTPFEGDFQNLKNQFGVSFAGNRGFYFSPEINDPTAQIFGKHIISANVAVKNPAPIYQVKFGMDTNIQTPRSIVPVDEKWLKENPEAIRQGGLALANSIDDVIAGKTMGMTGNFAAYEEQVKKAAKQNKLFALIDPEKLYDKQVNLLESKGYDGFNYVRPESATASMPSQIVAFRPEQIKRLSSGNEAQLLQDPANVQYKDPFADTIR
jgi:hypothetical protein